MVFASNVWHWWISVVLVVSAIGAVASIFVGYFRKMNSLKYPRR